MKIIQEYLKKCDRKAIINMYIYKYVFNYELMNQKYKDITCGEIRKKVTKLLNDYIDKLISIKPLLDKEETWILVTTHSYDTFSDEDIQHLLIKKSDLLNKSDLENVESYAYELSSFEDVVGYFVADTYLTQYEIDNLLVDFLHETSWTGFNHEDLERILNDLDESIKEEEEHKDDPNYYISAEDFMKKIEEEHGFKFEKKDEKQEKAHDEFLKHLIDYNNICKAIELQKLKNLLTNNDI